MKERFLSIVGGITGGVYTYAETNISNSVIDICVTIGVAFACGIAGYFGNELAKKIKAHAKK